MFIEKLEAEEIEVKSESSVSIYLNSEKSQDKTSEKEESSEESKKKEVSNDSEILSPKIES